MSVCGTADQSIKACFFEQKSRTSSINYFTERVMDLQARLRLRERFKMGRFFASQADLSK